MQGQGKQNRCQVFPVTIGTGSKDHRARPALTLSTPLAPCESLRQLDTDFARAPHMSEMFTSMWEIAPGETHRRKR